MLFSGSMMLPVAGWACVWQIPRRGPKCLKVVWLSTRAEEQPLTLLVISYRLCRRHKEGLQEVMEDKKNKKAPSLLQISRSIKANAAEPGSPYRSSLAEIYPNPTPPIPDPRRRAPEREQRMNGPLYYSDPCAVRQQHWAFSAASAAFITRLQGGL